MRLLRALPTVWLRTGSAALPPLTAVPLRLALFSAASSAAHRLAVTFSQRLACSVLRVCLHRLNARADRVSCVRAAFVRRLVH